MKTLIVENEPNSLRLLENIVDEYCPSLLRVPSATSLQEAIDLIKTHDLDLVFLDIQLDDGTAFDVLDQLDNRPFKVIFTTAFDQYAVKAFKYEATDYLLKPVSPKEVIKVVDRVRSANQSSRIFSKLKTLLSQNEGSAEGKLSISTNEGVNLVSISEITRVEADGSYSHFILNSGKRVVASKPLGDFEEYLDEQSFIRVHHGHLVNVTHIAKYFKLDGGHLEMKNGDVVPVSRRKKAELLSILGV